LVVRGCRRYFWDILYSIMATLTAIGVNVLVGTGILGLSLVAFGVAVRQGWNDKIAPRTWARPPETLKNVLGTRHAYWYGWIPWAVQVSYRTLLEGIPGTGTRSQGKRGPLLHCTIDGIILIRMQEVGLKVSALATLLYLGIVLPLNLSAGCSDRDYPPPSCTANNLTNLTNYQQTTLAYIPSLEEWDYDKSGYDQISYRFYAIVAVAWIIQVYTCFLLWHEWVENLALRRVFYLEHDHWESRMEELDLVDQLRRRQDEEVKQEDDDDERQMTTRNNQRDNNDNDDDEDIHVRPPWIPHPELRNLVPNVSLYSVLYRLPPHKYTPPTNTNDFLDKGSNHGTTGDGDEERNVPTPNYTSIASQLDRVIQFFDKCVPNQPGYSSSIAALTVLPDAHRLNFAWKKWYKCAKRLRRLRFIKSQIALRKREFQTKQKQNHTHREVPGGGGGKGGDGTVEANDVERGLLHSSKTQSGGYSSVAPPDEPTIILQKPRSSAVPRNSVPSTSPTGGNMGIDSLSSLASIKHQLVDIPENRTLSNRSRLRSDTASSEDLPASSEATPAGTKGARSSFRDDDDNENDNDDDVVAAQETVSEALHHDSQLANGTKGIVVPDSLDSDDGIRNKDHGWNDDPGAILNSYEVDVFTLASTDKPNENGAAGAMDLGKNNLGVRTTMTTDAEDGKAAPVWWSLHPDPIHKIATGGAVPSTALTTQKCDLPPLTAGNNPQCNLGDDVDKKDKNVRCAVQTASANSSTAENEDTSKRIECGAPQWIGSRQAVPATRRSDEDETKTPPGTCTPSKLKRKPSVTFSTMPNYDLPGNESTQPTTVELNEATGSVLFLGEMVNESSQQHTNEEANQFEASSHHAICELKQHLPDGGGEIAEIAPANSMSIGPTAFSNHSSSPPHEKVQPESGRAPPVHEHSLHIVDGKFWNAKDIYEYDDQDVPNDDDDAWRDSSRDSEAYVPAFTYSEFHKRKAAHCKELGFGEEYEMDMFVRSFGVEQMAVYGREFAQR
jgi:hypothetical protein